ncbi:GTP-binding protein Rho1 [Trapelia coarctata]|nr:GTP-binding protein Rho1 [Trapelia coarctata]
MDSTVASLRSDLEEARLDVPEVVSDEDRGNYLRDPLAYWDDFFQSKNKFTRLQSRRAPLIVPDYEVEKKQVYRLPDSAVTYCEPPPPYSYEYTEPKLGAERVKAVMVGAGACGKTCAAMSYTNGAFPNAYVPTVFETYYIDGLIDQEKARKKSQRAFQLGLFDTAGQREYSRLRPLSYGDADVMMVTYDVAYPDSLDIAAQEFLPEVKQYFPNVPIMLVGLQTDKRTSDSDWAVRARETADPVTYDDGVTVAQEIGAAVYTECSALTAAGLQEVFSTAVEVGWRYKSSKAGSKRDSKCCLM